MPPPERKWKILLLFLAVFTAVASLTYFPIFYGKVPFPAEMVSGFPPWLSVPERMGLSAGGADYGDIATLFYPWRQFQASAFTSGELPLWNPHILAGSPFLGNTESALFYPINAIFYVLPLPLAWTLKLLLNIVLAGTFTALFVRAIGGGNAGAISAGIVFALGGNMTTWQSTALVDAAVWLPLVCLGVHRLCHVKPDATAFAITAIAFAMPVLAGHPETAAHVTVVGIAYALCGVLFSGSTAVGARRTVIFGAAGLLAIGLAAIQILPTVEWLGQLNHTLGINWGTWKLREALMFFSRDIVANPNSSGLRVPESASYAGGLTLLFAPIALLHRNRRDALFFLMVILASWQIVFGGPAHWLIDQLPILSGLKNWRFLLVIDFSLAVLAGLGVAALAEAKGSADQKRTRIRAGIVALITFPAMLAGVWILENSRHADVPWLRSPGSTAAFLSIALVLLGARLFNWLRPRAFAAAAGLLFAADLISYAYGYLPFVSSKQIYPDAPLFAFLKSQSATGSRVVNLNVTYGVNAEMVYGLNAVGGWDLGLRLLKRFLDDIAEPTLDDLSITATSVAKNQDRRLDLLSAKYFVTNTFNDSYSLLSALPDRFSPVFSEGTVQVFENRRALPRSFFVPFGNDAVEVIPTEEAQIARLKDPQFDPERTVILAVMPRDSHQGLSSTTEQKKAEVKWVAESANRIELRTAITAPGVLVLSQIYFPGWQAFVDDVEAPILQTDYALNGVVLQPGARSVRFEYRPKSLRTGATITVLSLLVMGVILVRAVYRARFLTKSARS